MNEFTTAGGARFTRSGLCEAIVEAGLILAVAGFTAVIWLSAGAWAIAPGRAAEAAAKSSAAAPLHITLPTVVIVGRSDSPEGTPVATTAQNTAAIPMTLRQ